MEILKVSNIRKSFGSYLAVDNVSMTLESGRIYGLIGPNGAGKTTTIRMITNILMPDQGDIKLFGESADARHQNRIGYLPEERGLYKKIKVIDQLVYFGMLKDMKRADALKSAKNWLRQMDASDWENKKIQELSKGMQQKVQFIATIIHDPEFLILDEPFSGFDPVNAELMKKIIMDMKHTGKTIILSTHIMEQAEQMCDDIYLINKGHIVLSGNVREIKKRYERDYVIMEFEGTDSFLNGFHNLQFINRSQNRVEFRITDAQTTSEEILKAALLDQVKIFRFELAEPSLNEIFIDVVSKKVGGQ